MFLVFENNPHTSDKKFLMLRKRVNATTVLPVPCTDVPTLMHSQAVSPFSLLLLAAEVIVVRTYPFI